MEIDKIGYIYVEDRRLLSAISRGKNAFYIPGGKREPGETDEQTLIREVKEELTVDLIPETIEYHGTFRAQAHGKPEGTVVKMTCYTGKFNGNLKPTSEIERVDWLTSKHIPLVPPVDKLILADLKAKGIID